MEKDIPLKNSRERVAGPSPLQLVNRDLSWLAQSSISWRAIFAGVFVSLLSYLILMSLGLAIGGAILPSVIRGNTEGGGLGLGSGIWTVASLIISLFVGSYLAARVSGLKPLRMGGIQGLVIASLFFALLLSGLGSVVGSVGQGVGSVVSAAGGAAADLSQNPQLQATVEDALGGLNLKSPPGDVARGVATRLLQGDNESARNYLANQAGITRAEADRRIQGFQQRFQTIAKQAGATVAKAASTAAWVLFACLVLGSLFAWFGGASGMRASLSRPLSDRDLDLFRGRRAA